MRSKINIPLLVAIFIPIAMIIFISASIYLPVLFTHPKHNFLYSTGGYYHSDFDYVVTNSKLDKKLYPNTNNFPTYYSNSGKKTLFLHNISENKSRQISFEEAQLLDLDSNPVSEDGFEVTEGSGSYGLFPFFLGSYSRDSHFLKKDSYSQKLNLNTSGNYYGYMFLGWIK